MSGWCKRPFDNIDGRYVVNVRDPKSGTNHAYMSTDRLVRAGLEMYANVMPMTKYTGGIIWAGDNISSLPWNALTQGFLDEGDMIGIFDENGQSQVFTVDADVLRTDTTLSVQTQAAAFSIFEDYEIALQTHGCICRRYTGITLAPNTAYDFGLKFPDFSRATYSGSFVNKAVRVWLNGARWFYHDSGSSPPLFTFDSVTDGEELQFTSPIRSTDILTIECTDPLLYEI